MKNHCRGCRGVSISLRIEELFMNRGISFHRFVAPVLALGGALLVLGPQSASAQEITATVPFPFFVDNQQYLAGTYQFTLTSEWVLSIHNADGKQGLFPVRPERFKPLGSGGGDLTFCKCEGHNELLAVYIPGTDMTAELIGPRASRNEINAHISRSPMN
jgi:hypothetical protein